MKQFNKHWGFACLCLLLATMLGSPDACCQKGRNPVDGLSSIPDLRYEDVALNPDLYKDIPYTSCRALLLCHKVLSERHNTDSVNVALRLLDSVKNEVGGDDYSNLHSRLSEYDGISKALKTALSTAKDKMAEQFNDENKKQSFFNTLQEQLPSPSLLFDPYAYPYLYSVLQKAIETPDDCSKRIEQL